MSDKNHNSNETITITIGELTSIVNKATKDGFESGFEAGFEAGKENAALEAEVKELQAEFDTLKAEEKAKQ